MIRYILAAALFGGMVATTASAQDFGDDYGCGRIFVQRYSCPPPVYYHSPPVYYYQSPPVTYVEPTVKHDIYNDEYVSSKFYVKARFPDYNNYRCELPVINGYLPSVTVTKDGYGRVARLALDYRSKEFKYDHHYSSKSEIVYTQNSGTSGSSGKTELPKRPAPKVTESITGGATDPLKKPMPKIEDRGSPAPAPLEKRPAPKLYDDKGSSTPPTPAPTKDQRIEELLKGLRGSGEFKSSNVGGPVAPKVESPSGLMRPSDVTQPEVEKTKKFPRYDD